MYTYYCIKIVLMDGRTGYAAFNQFTPNINESMFFDTYEEAKNWFYRNTVGSSYGGVPINRSQCRIVSVSSASEI